MGWLAVAANVLALYVGGFGAWMAVPAHSQNHNFAPPLDASFNPGGWLLALVLFILARIFRQGTSMSQDLEGTV